MTNNTLPMNMLEINQEAVIMSVSDECEIKRRLYELGFVPGTVVRCVLRAPLGDPKAFEVKNTLVSVRREESRYISVLRKDDAQNTKK